MTSVGARGRISKVFCFLSFRYFVFILLALLTFLTTSLKNLSKSKSGLEKILDRFFCKVEEVAS